MARRWQLIFVATISVFVGLIVVGVVVLFPRLRQPATAVPTPQFGIPDAALLTVLQEPPLFDHPVQLPQLMFHTVAPAYQAQAIYAQMTAGPIVPPDARQSCGSVGNYKPYYRYDVIFYQLGQSIGYANINAFATCLDIVMTYHNGVQKIFFYDEHGTSFFAVLHQITSAPLPLNLFYFPTPIPTTPRM